MEVKQFIFNMFQENTYVLTDEEKNCIIIDPGCFFEEEQERLVGYIRSNGLRLTRIIQTHLHLDHIFGCQVLFDGFGIQPEAHASDEFFLDIFPTYGRKFGIDEELKCVPLKSYLSDGDVIKLGDSELHVIHTPGHSPGGVCFYAPKEKLLFSGDSLFMGSIGRTDLERGNGPELIRSLTEKLMVLPVDTTVLPGHGPKTSIGFEKANNPYIHE